MRILLTSLEYGRSRGGVASAVERIARGLVAAGHRVRVLARDTDDPRPPELGEVRELGEDGFVFGLDLSARMLDLARRKLKDLPQAPQLVSGNSQCLPFPDGVFDAVLDGAGTKYYSDKRRALREMLRVVKPGGKVLIAELGMPSDKRPTFRQRMLLLWIPGFREGPPCGAIPSEATDVRLDWDDEETFFALEFCKAPERGR